MLLIILNALVLSGGLIFVLIQYLGITAAKRSLARKLKIFVDGYWLSLIGFTSVLFSVLSSRSLLLTGDFKTVITAVIIAAIIYMAFIIGWIRLKKLLGADFIQKGILEKQSFFSPKLTKQFMNLTIYGLIYAFAVIFYIIILINYWKVK
ncbi:MAG: hypothetical protein M0R05_04225 [Bacilli bacterium]|nr:hypothetical protein [Bacilli bacterium]MDD4076845.1 hypothetical protein [Bacilli bacterium]MDD4389050.1 hypothetical protein [Bacilli bacterium]